MRKYKLIVAMLMVAGLLSSGCQKEHTKDDSSNVKVEENKENGEKQGKPEQSEEKIILENEAFQVISPIPNQKINGTFIVEGKARVFEASFQYRLEDGHNVLAEGHVMAAQGAPEWGEFKFEIYYKGATSPNAVITLFEGSPKDGSPQHELLIPLLLENYQ